MAYPKWITPEGNLGIVPELEYYQFSFDSYDVNGGTLSYSLISGRLPLGLQIISTGKIQGIPVSSLQTGDINEVYRFTIRVKNLSTGSVSDRTFNITITNVAPPVIIPRNVDLGLYLDGTEISIQLEAVEFTPGADLTWTLNSGSLPPGLNLSSSGLIYGYLEPIPGVGPESDPGWDDTPWSLLGWDFPLGAINQTFTFEIEVFDGVNYDITNYIIEVFPRSTLTADNSILTVDTTRLETGAGLITNDGVYHAPIITTVQNELVPVRQGSYFSFDFDAIDLDGDVIQYAVPSSAAGTFDEQSLAGNSIPYVAATPISGNLYAGVWPKVSSIDIGGVETTVVDLTQPNYVNGDVIKVINSSEIWQEATVNNHSSIRLQGNAFITTTSGDTITQDIGGANATVTAVSSITGNISFGGNTVTANVGDFITQSSTGANATVSVTTAGASIVAVTFNSGTFALGSGNVSINGSAVASYPTSAYYLADVGTYYNTVDTFDAGSTADEANVKINGTNSWSRPIAILSMGVTLGSSASEGTIGYDEGRFDQGTLEIPTGLSIDINTGWMTGTLPWTGANETEYQFEIIAYKRDDSSYRDSQLYTLTVLGDLNNKIEWVTGSNLGTIENGKVSDLYIEAVSTKGNPVFYDLIENHHLPQGLVLTTSGLLMGRVSFELFSLDAGTTTIDSDNTTFDETYTFTVRASDYGSTVSNDRTFTIRVLQRNVTPYENLYLKALLPLADRDSYENLTENQSIFPRELIYRFEDPNFGIAKNLKTLFLAGLAPSELADYATAVETNHYTKQIQFGEIKTAVANDTNFNTKYEVVYIEIIDENTSVAGEAPASSINLASTIDNPYYDSEGNSYTTVYPNAFGNMRDKMVTSLGYANKGALPDWMTSRQENGRVLGFTRAVVLAYTVPGASAKIAYRLQNSLFNFNALDFEVDRYQVDNSLSDYWDYNQNEFFTSSQTTFDRYPIMPSVFNDRGTVNYALSTAFDQINNRPVSYIRNDLGGLDGYKNFKDGDLLVFAEQEFYRDQNDVGEYNQGWSRVLTLWSGSDSWDFDNNTATTSDDLGWDAADYVPGYTENLLSSVDNERIGIWQINISNDDIVTLTFVSTMDYFDKVYVKNGFTYGGTNIYYDRVVKPGNTLPNYSIFPQEIRTVFTTFDGDGTRFFDYRNSYANPESGDKYIKFAKTGVFT